AADHRAVGILDAERVSQVGSQILDRDADPAAPHLAVLDDLPHYGGRHVYRHGEPDADIAAGRRYDRGVDPDEAAVGRDKRSAGIAGVDRGIGLDEVLVALDVDAAPIQRANDAGGHGLPETEGIADGHHAITNAQRV